MDYAKLVTLFSKSRLSKYLIACSDDEDKAVRLYEYNIQVSEALHPLISLLEVALRNAIDRELTKRFNDNDWLLNQRPTFANHPDLYYRDRDGNIQSDTFFLEKLEKAEAKLHYRKAPLSHGKLLAELTFGFWVKFFDTQPIKILKGVPLDAFLNKPSIKLALVHSHLNGLVNLRNRISHCEPICFDRQGKLCLTTIRNYEVNITQSLGWLDTSLMTWSNSMNKFKPIYDKIAAL